MGDGAEKDVVDEKRLEESMNTPNKQALAKVCIAFLHFRQSTCPSRHSHVVPTARERCMLHPSPCHWMCPGFPCRGTANRVHHNTRISQPSK